MSSHHSAKMARLRIILALGDEVGGDEHIVYLQEAHTGPVSKCASIGMLLRGLLTSFPLEKVFFLHPCLFSGPFSLSSLAPFFLLT